jgi:hypothetical protein
VAGGGRGGKERGWRAAVHGEPSARGLEADAEQTREVVAAAEAERGEEGRLVLELARKGVGRVRCAP